MAWKYNDTYIRAGRSWVGTATDEEGNTFLDILMNNPDIQCFILNTGRIGGMDRGRKITVRDSVKIMEMIARDKIVWKKDEFWGYEVPVQIPGLELNQFDLSNYSPEEQIQQLSENLKQERLEWLSQFHGLDQDIISAIKP